MEQIYAIPVNAALDASIADPSCGCAICTLYKQVEQDKLAFIMGPAMMEPSTREDTNREGFCQKHLHMMLTRKNRLSLALMVETHLSALQDDLLDPKVPSLRGRRGDRASERIERLMHSCYVCHRIDDTVERMIGTLLFLWQGDPTVREKVAKQPHFCLPHYRMILLLAKAKLSRADYNELYTCLSQLEMAHLAELHGDVGWFCKKFDYRYTDEPWYNAKDSIERATAFLTADEGRKPDDDR